MMRCCLLFLLLSSLVLIEGARGRRRASLASYSSGLSAVESSVSASGLLQSSACFNPSGSLYDAIQTLPDTMITAQFLKLPEFKHLAEIIQSTDNDQKLTMMVPTDESIHNALVVHYNMTCKQSNEFIDAMIAQVADKANECKKLDLLVRMTGLMTAMGKKMKSMHKQAYKTGAKTTGASPTQSMKTGDTTAASSSACPVNAPCPAASSPARSSGSHAALGVESSSGGVGRKHLLCSSPALRRDALMKLCDQLGIRQEDFNLTFSALDIHAATDNFLYSIVPGQYSTKQFSSTNILTTLLDDPAIVRLNTTDPTANKQVMFIQQSDSIPSQYQIVYGIPSSEHSWYSNIIRPNLRASNGVLHLIDGPLHAPMNPIFQLAHAKFSNFLSMALEAGLAPMLANKPATTLFVPVESASRLIKNAFGFESNEATIKSMLKDELISELKDILATAKVNRYMMQDTKTGQQQPVMANQPLALKLLHKARSVMKDADSLKMEKHSVLAAKFGEMHLHEQKVKGLMGASPSVAGGPVAWDPNQYSQWNYDANLDRIRQAAQQFIAQCLQQFGQQQGPSIYINPRSSTGILPPDASPSQPPARGVLGSGLSAQSIKRRRFGMSMKSKDDQSIEVPMKGWEYRLNRPSLLNDPLMAAVEHIFTHEKILSQSLFDNWNKTQTYADFINLHTFDGLFYTNTFQDGLILDSMQGQSFSITNASDSLIAGGNWKIDQSNIIFPNIITSNGVIHIIDQPLGIDLLPTTMIKQLLQQSPALRAALTGKQVNRGLLGLLGPCPSPALKSLKAKAFPAKKKASPALPIKSSSDEQFDSFDDDEDDSDFDDDFDDDWQYIIPSALTSDQQITMISIRHISEIIAKFAPQRGDEMMNACIEELPQQQTSSTTAIQQPSITPVGVQPTKPAAGSAATPTTPTTSISSPMKDVTRHIREIPQPSVPTMPAPTPQELGCPPLDQVCVVNDPLLYSTPKPICYSPKTHVCVNNNFLCPTHAPNACGRACYDEAIYSCKNLTATSRLLVLNKAVEGAIKKPKAAPSLSNVQPILDALAQMKAKQSTTSTQKVVPPIQTKPSTTTAADPIVDVLTNPALLRPVSQQPVKSATASQPLSSTVGQSIKSSVQSQVAKAPSQIPVSGQSNLNKPRN